MSLDEYISNLKGKSVTAIGAGVSNLPLIRLLLENNISVTVRDKAPEDKFTHAEELRSLGCQLILGENYLKDISADVIFRSPGIRPDLPEIQAAVSNGAKLTSEMEAFFDVCPCPVIAVTGSDGKTTTTTVISEILKADGKTVHTGGNIGSPLLDKSGSMSKDDFCVVELSSFQLMTMRKSPTRAVITNIAPNHLDFHKNMEEYISAKKNIFANLPRPEAVVLNADNDITCGFAAQCRDEARFFSRLDVVENGAYCENGVIYTSRNNNSVKLMDAKDIFLPGEHNVENYLAAFAALSDIASSEAMIKTAKTFKGVPHRIEFVRELHGVRYYNDSIASSPSRTRAGLRSFDKKVILIAGGKDKGVPFDELGRDIREHVKTLVVTGMARDKIIKAVNDAGGGVPIIEREDFKDAVLEAANAAQNGDIVLLSPACTSFDRFKNFEERGNLFKEIVKGLE